jgi:ABC-type multidrug transport system fused ATPase/permease subunit
MVGTGQILINVVLPKFLIDELIGELNPRKLIFYGALIVIFNVVFALFAQAMKRIMDLKNMYMKESLSLAMAEKIMKVEFSYLENPYYLDIKERAVFAINNHNALENMIVNLTDLVKNLITLIGVITIMFTLSPVLILLLSCTIIITLLIQGYFSKYQTKFFKEVIPINRKYGYYINLAYQDKLQKDIRLYGMNKLLTDRIALYNDEVNDWFTKFYKRIGLVQSLYSIINDLQAAIAYGYVGMRVLSSILGPQIGIGSFTMYVSAAINFTATFNAFGSNITRVIQLTGHIDPFIEFMSLPDEEKKEGTIPFTGEIKTLSFENVTFSYPGSDQLVLKGISFMVEQGEKISIVGLNGAGKSTIVKLLCRLYQPNSGNIKINGHNIYEYEFTSYMKGIAAVFQDYKLFAFSLKENIICTNTVEEEKHILELVDKVGLKNTIEKLPEGIHSLYGKAYNEKGFDISGGESQKIAIARALYKEASLIILDEPTSALDPLAEAEIYEKFNQLVGSKTALYISHRMSSSVFCDKILVLDNGHITDFDSHVKLMEKKESMYYKLFKSQAVNYQN